MARKRMLSADLIDSDGCIDLSLPAQALHMFLFLHADDAGFTNKARSACRLHGVSEEAIAELEESGYLIGFGNGVYLLTHWHICNLIEPTKYTETIYQEELKLLDVRIEECLPKSGTGKTVQRVWPSEGQIYRLLDNSEKVSRDSLEDSYLVESNKSSRVQDSRINSVQKGEAMGGLGESEGEGNLTNLDGVLRGLCCPQCSAALEDKGDDGNGNNLLYCKDCRTHYFIDSDGCLISAGKKGKK